MRLKHLFLCGATVLASTMLFSCQQENEPKQPIDNSIDLEGMVEWSAEIKLPDELRTRAAANGTVGSDGLYSFTREIDRLWYAVYYNGQYLYDSEQTDAPNAVKTSDGQFTVKFKFHNTIDFTKVYMFFWAGNNDDNVTINDVQTVTNGINLNFKKRCVSVDPKYMNGDNSELKEYDSFSGYVQLSNTQEVSNYSIVATLHRPFAQIHILSDEFTFPGVYADFKNGVTVMPGFGNENATLLNYTNNMVSPTTWFYDSSLDLTPGFLKNEFQFSPTTYEFTNTLSGVSPERVTFKNRTMDYLGCYYVFAPIEKSPLKLAQSTGTPYTLGKVNLAFRKVGDNISSSEFASVDLPSEGICANNRYVIYNKAADDVEDDDDNGGFISKKFVFEVVTDPEWENPDTEIKK